MTLSLLICLIGLAVYLICDALEKFAAIQEIARLAFVAGLLAFLLKGV